MINFRTEKKRIQTHNSSDSHKQCSYNAQLEDFADELDVAEHVALLCGHLDAIIVTHL